MYLRLNRIDDNHIQTIGRLTLLDSKKNVIFSMCTLELTWAHNSRNESCIPCGWYSVKRRWSVKYGMHLQIMDVENRSMILIHHGNFYGDTNGCILVGTAFKDINKDGILDVVNSKFALNTLLKLIPNSLTLVIKNDKNLWKV
jgi:hypothetical protein